MEPDQRTAITRQVSEQAEVKRPEWLPDIYIDLRVKSLEARMADLEACLAETVATINDYQNKAREWQAARLEAQLAERAGIGWERS